MNDPLTAFGIARQNAWKPHGRFHLSRQIVNVTLVLLELPIHHVLELDEAVQAKRYAGIRRADLEHGLLGAVAAGHRSFHRTSTATAAGMPKMSASMGSSSATE